MEHATLRSFLVEFGAFEFPLKIPVDGTRHVRVDNSQIEQQIGAKTARAGFGYIEHATSRSLLVELWYIRISLENA